MFSLSLSYPVFTKLLEFVNVFILPNLGIGRAWWLTPIIPALWEAKAGGSRGREIEAILVNMVKPRLYSKYKKLAGHCGACL